VGGSQQVGEGVSGEAGEGAGRCFRREGEGKLNGEAIWNE